MQAEESTTSDPVASVIQRDHQNEPQCDDGALWHCRQVACVNGRVKMKRNTTDLSQKSLPTTLKISSSNPEGCSEGKESKSMKSEKY